MKKLWISYLLYFFGLHRIYLGRYFSGVLYIFTAISFGSIFFFIWAIVDFFLVPKLVRDANVKLFGEKQVGNADLENEIYLMFAPSWSRRTLRKLYSVSRNLDRKNEKKQAKTLQRILQAANRRGGTITAQELIMDTGLMAGEAEQQLEQLLKQNFCTLEVGDDGCMFYKFEGLRNAETKRAARNC